MINYIPLKINLDGNVEGSIKIKQRDHLSRYVELTILDNTKGSPPLDLTGCTARMYVDMVQQGQVYIEGEVADGVNGLVTFLLPNAVTQNVGTYAAEIWLNDPVDGSQMSTPPFEITVQKSIRSDGAIEASEKFDALEIALQNIDSINARVTALEAAGNEQTASEKIADKAVTAAKLESTLRNTIANIPTVPNGTVNAILCTAYSYIEHNDRLIYGHKTATRSGRVPEDLSENIKWEYRSDSPNDIDCASFVAMVLNGVPYEDSVYAGLAENTSTAGYCYKFHNSMSWLIAEELYNKGLAFVPPTDIDEFLETVHPGDILFISEDTGETFSPPLDERFLRITHVVICVGKRGNYPTSGTKGIVTVECGNYTKFPDSNGDSSVIRTITRTNTLSNCTLIARLPLANVPTVSHTVTRYAAGSTTGAIPFSVPKHRTVYVSFDGTLSEAGKHFTVMMNGTGIATTADITADAVNVRRRYSMAIPIGSAAAMTNCTILAPGNSGTIHGSVVLSDYPFFDRNLDSGIPVITLGENDTVATINGIFDNMQAHTVNHTIVQTTNSTADGIMPYRVAWLVETYKYTGECGTQTARTYFGDSFYMRRRTSDGWTAWAKFSPVSE